MVLILLKIKILFINKNVSLLKFLLKNYLTIKVRWESNFKKIIKKFINKPFPGE